MEAATGDFISFVDPDDILNPIYFEHLHQQIEKYDSDIAVCGYNIILNDDPSQIHSQVFPTRKKLWEYILGKSGLPSMEAYTI